jgi:glycopeptide antibiotics resistance protein
MGTRTRVVLLVVAGVLLLGAVLVVGFSPVRVDGLVQHQVRAFVDQLRADGWSWIDYDTIDFIANIGFFVPLGLIGALLLPWRMWWLAIPIGAMISGAIELGQALFLPARYASLTDVLANTLGALVGALIGAAVRAASRRRAPRAARR